MDDLGIGKCREVHCPHPVPPAHPPAIENIGSASHFTRASPSHSNGPRQAWAQQATASSPWSAEVLEGIEYIAEQRRGASGQGPMHRMRASLCRIVLCYLTSR